LKVKLITVISGGFIHRSQKSTLAMTVPMSTGRDGEFFQVQNPAKSLKENYPIFGNTQIPYAQYRPREAYVTETSWMSSAVSYHTAL